MLCRQQCGPRRAHSPPPLSDADDKRFKVMLIDRGLCTVANVDVYAANLRRRPGRSRSHPFRRPRRFRNNKVPTFRSSRPNRS